MQPLFRWSPDSSVAIQKIDAQHMVLVDLLSRLHNAVIKRKGSSVCRGIPDRLVEKKPSWRFWAH